MGENVLVVGASGSIGKAIAKGLADSGCQLLLHYHKNKEAIDELYEAIPYEQILMDIQADLSTENGIMDLLDKIMYSVDAIVFAGGNAHYGLFQDVSAADMNEMLTLHVKAPWLITRNLLPAMIHNKEGTVILITSVWGHAGASNEVIYSSVKGAQNSFVKALAKEVAPSGISVNAISPGFIDTKMNHNLTALEKQQIIDQIPMNRAGKPEEVAHAVVFLMDKQSNYIQGQIIDIDGAWQ